MILKIMHGGVHNGPILATEDGTQLPGQFKVEIVDQCQEIPRIKVEFLVDGKHIQYALHEWAERPS